MSALIDQLTAARFDAVLDEATAGRPVLMRLRRPDTLARLLDRAQTGPLALYTAETTLPSPTAALLTAARELGAEADDLEQLVTAPALRHALLVGLAARNEAAWVTVAGAFAALRRRHGEEGPALLVVGSMSVAARGFGYFDDGCLIGPVEAALIAHLRRPAAGLVAQAADAAAVEVARGDLVMLERLLDLGDAERLDPSDWIARQPCPRTAEPLPWRGEEAPCPCWLARHDRATLRRRVWRGHLSVLLPWLEEMRSRFLTLHGRRLPGSQIDRISGEPVDLADQEWGHIFTALRRIPAAPAAAADVMRRVRNMLAHGDPASRDDCRRLESEAQRLLAWR